MESFPTDRVFFVAEEILGKNLAKRSEEREGGRSKKEDLQIKKLQPL